MVAKNLLNDVLSLPAADRLELYEQLRQNILNDPEIDQLSDGGKRLLDERLAEHEADPYGGIPWEEVEARMEKLFKARA